MRLSVTDIFHVFSNFLGLRPSLLPTGSHLFTVDKDNCRKSLLLDDPHRRAVLADSAAQRALGHSRHQPDEAAKHAISTSTTSCETIDDAASIALHGRLSRRHHHDPLLQGDHHRRRLLHRGRLPGQHAARQHLPGSGGRRDHRLSTSPTTTITPNSTRFTARASSRLPFTSIDTHLLVSDLQLTLPNKRIFAQAELINRMLEAMGKDVDRDRRPHLVPQADPRAPPEEPGEHDDFAEGRDRAEALFRARSGARRQRCFPRGVSGLGGKPAAAHAMPPRLSLPRDGASRTARKFLQEPLEGLVCAAVRAWAARKPAGRAYAACSRDKARNFLRGRTGSGASAGNRRSGRATNVVEQRVKESVTWRTI